MPVAKNLSPTISLEDLYGGDENDKDFAIPESILALRKHFSDKIKESNKIYSLIINCDGKEGVFYVKGGLILGKLEFTGVIAAIDRTCQIKSVEVTDEHGTKSKEYRTIPMFVVWLRLSQSVVTDCKTFGVGEVVPIALRDTLLGNYGALTEFYVRLKHFVSGVKDPFDAITMLWTFGLVKHTNEKGSWYQVESTLQQVSPQTLTMDERRVMKQNIEDFASNPKAVTFDPLDALMFSQLPYFSTQAALLGIYPPIHRDDFQRMSTSRGLIDPEGWDIRVSPIVEALMGSPNKALPAAEELTAEEAKASIGM